MTTTSRRLRGAGLALAALVVPLAASGAALAHDGRNPHHGGGSRPGTFAVIGDLPYSPADIAHFPGWVDDLNADPDVTSVLHLGDIKSGSTQCTDAWFDYVRGEFDRFEDPLVYTPGDNEWTDCHRANNGGYDPLERLAAVRDTFFDRPGTTLGGRMRVTSQASEGVPENVRFERYGLSFAALHVVGSNNDLAPWNGTDTTVTGPNGRQVIEEHRRMDATIDEVHDAFAAAERHHLRGVVLFMQADMFDESYGGTSAASFADYSAFAPLVQSIIDESADYYGPVYLFNGDSHVFRADQPLADGSPWLDFYGVAGSADNLTRVVVDGSSQAAKGYLKVSVASGRHSDDVLSWEEVPYASTAVTP